MRGLAFPLAQVALHRIGWKGRPFGGGRSKSRLHGLRVLSPAIVEVYYIYSIGGEWCRKHNCEWGPYDPFSPFYLPISLDRVVSFEGSDQNS